MNNDSSFLDFDEFKQKYRISIDFVTYEGLLRAVKKYRMTLNLTLLETQTMIQAQKPYTIILKSKKGSSEIYKQFLSNELPNGVKKWKSLKTENYSWNIYFKTLIETTKDTKLRWLQFRIMHSILTTNRTVSKYNAQQIDICSFCQQDSETIEHLLWECPCTTNFIIELENYLHDKCPHLINLKIVKDLFIFGYVKNLFFDCILYTILLLAKNFIYRCKFDNVTPKLCGFIPTIRYRYKIEQCIHASLGTHRSKIKEWLPYNRIIE